MLKALEVFLFKNSRFLGYVIFCTLNYVWVKASVKKLICWFMNRIVAAAQHTFFNSYIMCWATRLLNMCLVCNPTCQLSKETL